jgi:hypothetical protein
MDQRIAELDQLVRTKRWGGERSWQGGEIATLEILLRRLTELRCQKRARLFDAPVEAPEAQRAVAR